MGFYRQPQVKTYRITATDAEDLRRQMPNIQLQPGSTGRLEIYARRFLGVCPVFLGQAMAGPAGEVWARELTGRGFTVTGRGGIGGFLNVACDAYVDFQVAPAMNQRTRMAFGPVAIVAIALAAAAALAFLGWVIDRIVASIHAFVDIIPKPARGILGWVIVAGIALAVLSYGKRLIRE